MPEGDSVWRAARRLHTALAGEILTRSDLRVPRFATADLTGRRVQDVTPRGKHLLARIDGGLTLHSHLRMDGAWHVFAPGERWRGGPEHEIRAILGTDRHTAVGYRLPVLELLRTSDEAKAVGHLGPDLLGPDWDPERAAANLRADPARPLGEALLDQRNLAGIGNVYKCELCFLAQVTPWTPVGAAPDPLRLAAAAHRLLEANKDRRRNTTGRRSGPDHFVYGREHRPCLRCGAPVRRAEQDGRPTYWCPRCQSGPTSDQPQATTVVTRFNDRINARDLDGLADLMSEDHTFTDTAGSTLTGKADCLQAWAGFFAAFPDYRNVFTAVSARGGEVTATGRSSCSALLLDGPARWTARVRDGLVTSWQVHEAAPDHNHDRDDGDDGDDRDHNR